MADYRLRDWLRILRRIVLAFGVLLSFFAILELLRAYQTLYFFHPYVGYAFLGVIVIGLVWFLIYVFAGVIKRPSVLKPPNILDPENATIAELVDRGKYLTKYARRIGENECLPINARESILADTGKIESSLRKASAEDKLEVLKKIEEEIIEPAVSELDKIAEKDVRTCVRDIAIGVTLSPWRSTDLFIVLFRNYGMILRIIRTYNSRPRFSEIVIVFTDVFRVVAYVNYTNLLAKLLEGLLRWVPGIGKYVDDIVQGVGAGLLTSMAGHATIHRCRAYRGWGEEEAVKGITVHAGNFMRDVKGLITQDIIPKIKSRIVPEEKADQEEEIIIEIASGVSRALDETAEDIERFVEKPVIVARTKPPSRVKSIGTKVVSLGTIARRKTYEGGKVTLRGAGKGAGFIGRYTASLWRKRKERLQNKK